MFFFTKELLIQPYNPNTVIKEYTIPGTYTSDLIIKGDGVYEIEAVSAGAGGNQYDTLARYWYSNCGATGAYYKGNIRLQKGQYTINIGSGSNGVLQYDPGPGGPVNIITQGQTKVFELLGGTGCGTTSSSAGGYLNTIINETQRIIYREGYSSSLYVAYNYPISRSNQNSPAVDYSLGAYGQGGGCYYDGYTASGYNGTGGYLKVTYKGLI